MTKFTKLSDLLGQEEKPKGKPIEFTQYIGFDKIETKNVAKPKDWDNVLHICKDENGLDIFIAYFGNRMECGGIYRGHLNDGFIEQ